MVAFAANSLLCRAALGAGLASPGFFTGVRLASGAIVLGALVALRGPGRRRPSGGSWASGAALFAYAAAFSLAYVRIPASVGALLLFPSVQVSMIAWAIRGGDRLARRQWVGIATALAGLAAMNLPGARAPDPGGAALMVAAGVAWAVYSVRGRASEDPLATTADNFVRSVPFAALFALVPGAAAQTAGGTALAIASGALASGLGYALWYAALPLLGVTRAAIVQLSVPAVAALGGVLLLGERLVPRVVVAGCAILVGTALATLRGQPRRNRSSSAATSSGASSAR
jgi:drug/metabolite transporter (DMT)-like permease